MWRFRRCKTGKHHHTRATVKVASAIVPSHTHEGGLRNTHLTIAIAKRVNGEHNFLH